MMMGGCLCGRIRYRAAGAPYHAGYCHCVTCRRASGAPVAAWFSNKLGDIAITGEPVRYRSSDHGERLFCGACGTQLFFDDSRFPDELDISIASLDDPARVPPEFHLFASRRIPWVRFADGLESFAETRESEAVTAKLAARDAPAQDLRGSCASGGHRACWIHRR